MTARPTPPRTDLPTTRALLAAARGKQRYKAQNPTGPVIRWERRTVIRATSRHPYGRSTQARGYLTHLVAHIYIAWLHGRMIGHLVRWRCGSDTQHFRLLDEPNSPLCPVCVAYAFGREGLGLALGAGRAA